MRGTDKVQSINLFLLREPKTGIVYILSKSVLLFCTQGNFSIVSLCDISEKVFKRYYLEMTHHLHNYV